MHILRNLVEMTEQRDHLRLEISVLSTFMQLPHIVDVRALELLRIDSEYWFRPHVWRQDKQFATAQQDFVHDPARRPLQTLPVLHQCVTEHRLQTQQDLATGQHIIWLPVWLNEQVQACMEITLSRAPSKHELDVMLAIFNVYQNYQSLLDYSERDALTGLLNRKTFDEQLLRFAAQEQHGQEHSWLAVIDVDFFKHVNDRFGHLFGDEVLILVGNLLRSSFDTQFRIFRFGGEEFVVLMPPMREQEAFAALDSFRAAVASYSFPQLGMVTVSIGFASARLSAPIEVLGQADRALYYAKEHGRNRVCQFEQLAAAGLLADSQVSHNDVELF